MLALAPQHVNARDNVGYTPLHWAAGKGHVAIVQVSGFNMGGSRRVREGVEQVWGGQGVPSMARGLVGTHTKHTPLARALIG